MTYVALAAPRSCSPRRWLCAVSVGAALTVGAASVALAKPAAKSAMATCGADNLLAGRRPTASNDVRGELGLVTDGAVGPEGAEWDAPVAVTWDTLGGSLTYDLGAAHQVAAVFVQADANDTYRLTGSLEGTPGTFKPLAEVANVLDHGHGLRTRSLEIPPTTVRYVQVSATSGDNFFSISELALFCAKPDPFPPRMRFVDAPVARVGAPAALPPAQDDGKWTLLLIAAAGGLVWLAVRMFRHRPEGSSGAVVPGAVAQGTVGAVAPGASVSSDPPKEVGGGDTTSSGGSGGTSPPEDPSG